MRRACLAPLLLSACVASSAHEDEAAAARLPQRIALLAKAQAELEHGNANSALDDFERAAMMLHASDAELGLIRAAMQDGQYRRALAFCAHTAGEHTDDPDGGALYAWLLDVGGQPELAERTIAQARDQAPGDALVAAVEAAFVAAPPVARGVLLDSTHRMAPWPVMLGEQSPVSATARFASNAVLMEDGSAALLPASSIATAVKGARLWVRNGLGQTTEAVIDGGDTVLTPPGIVRVRLRVRMDVGASREVVGGMPFAGSPAYTLQFGSSSEPAWPMLSAGFLGGPIGDTNVRKLGFRSTSGAPVFDSRGALVGIALQSAGGLSTWVPILSSAAASPPVAHGAPVLLAPDEIYEAGLRRALQLLVDAPG
jgi:tetratricopeptide (TPR) repeat protein